VLTVAVRSAPVAFLLLASCAVAPVKDARSDQDGPPYEILQVAEIKVGDGAEATAGQKVTVHYVGTLTDGKKFDSSRDRGKGFSFELGKGQVIKGWDKGVAGMKIGGMRKLTIPPEMAYGDRGFPPVIPPGVETRTVARWIVTPHSSPIAFQ